MTAAWEMRAVPDAAYPYDAPWDGERVRPLALRIISDPACRAGLLGDPVPDFDLATPLHFVANEAGKATEGLGSSAFWDGLVEGRVARFLAEQAEP